MNRRELLIAIGASLLATPLGSFAQQPSKVWRVGFLYIGTCQSALDTGRYVAFLEGMSALGYLEGKHFIVEERFVPDGEYQRLPGLAADLVRSNVDVIVTAGAPAILALKQATTTVPIVFAITIDPVREGIAASLARPGGNVTGLSAFLNDVFPKHVELLKIAIPKLSRIAVLSKPGNPGHPGLLQGVDAVARKRGIRVLPVNGDTPKEIERGFGTMARQRAEALIILGDSFFVQHFRSIAGLAIKHRLATTYSGREYADAGGLMSYGPDFADNFRRAAAYVDKILKGAKPGELPIEQPTRIYLTINRKTAKAIGLTIPQELLLRADKVIE